MSAKGRSARGRGRPLDDINAREIILGTAAKLFSDKGLDGVTVREIAEQSGVTMPTLYHHFENKLGLYRSVVLDQQNRTEIDLNVRLASVETRAQFKDWLALLIEQIFRHREFHRLIYRELFRTDDDLHRFMAEQSFAPTLDLLRERMNLIRSGAGDGFIPLVILSAAAGLFALRPYAGFLEGYAELSPDKLPSQQEVLSIADALIKLLD